MFDVGAVCQLLKKVCLFRDALPTINAHIHDFPFAIVAFLFRFYKHTDRVKKHIYQPYTLFTIIRVIIVERLEIVRRIAVDPEYYVFIICVIHFWLLRVIDKQLAVTIYVRLMFLLDV